MLSVEKLRQLRTQVKSREMMRGISVLSAEQALDLIDQAIQDRNTIHRWYGFLKLMAQRSSWGEKITELLNEYIYGTENKQVQAAVDRYLEMTKLHDRSQQ